MTHNPKHMTLLKAQYDPTLGLEERAAISKAFHEMSETEQVQFNEFAHDVGNIFLQVMEELDAGLEELADAFPDETDPRKWGDGDWVNFYAAVIGHKYEDLYITYAEQKPNIHLVWKEIEQRIG